LVLGTPCYANNHELLKGIKNVHLSKSVYRNLFKDCLNKSKDPLSLIKVSGNEKELMHLWRSFYYNQAKYKLLVDDKTIDQTVNDKLF
jgi:shikimate kinase